MTADGVVITEGNRMLTVATPLPRSADDPARQIGHIMMYYDHGVVEVYSPLAGPAAVICNRRAVYALIEVDVSAHFETPSCVASVTAWSCGRS